MKPIPAAVLAIACLMSVGAAHAQGTAPAPAKPTPAASPASQPAAGAKQGDHSAKSLACSTEADKQGLHGKARKAFRSRCKRGSA